MTEKGKFLFYFSMMMLGALLCGIVLGALLLITTGAQTKKSVEPIGQGGPPAIAVPMEPQTFEPMEQQIRIPVKYHIMLFSSGGMVIGDWISKDRPEPLPGNMIRFTDSASNSEVQISGTFIMEEVKDKYKPKGP